MPRDHTKNEVDILGVLSILEGMFSRDFSVFVFPAQKEYVQTAYGGAEELSNCALCNRKTTSLTYGLPLGMCDSTCKAQKK